MILRAFSHRRGFTTKLLLLSLAFVCFLFYIKLSTNDDNTTSPITTYNNRKIIAGKLVNEYIEQNVNNKNIIDNNNENDLLPSVDDSIGSIAFNGFVDQNRYNEYEQQIRHDLSKQVPGLGNDGRSAKLTDETSKLIAEKQLANIALNEELSEHLSYNRTLDDARNPLCRNNQYDLNGLPTASIVVIFYNEPYSVLVRTIHSVLNTCDQRVLKEIILVDDCSTNVELKSKLDYYIQTKLPKDVIKMVRLKHRYVICK